MPAAPADDRHTKQRSRWSQRAIDRYPPDRFLLHQFPSVRGGGRRRAAGVGSAPQGHRGRGRVNQRRWTCPVILPIRPWTTCVQVVEVQADDDDADADDVPEEDDYADIERAHLIISKSFKSDLGVQGRNLTVEIQIFNAGSSSALAVDLTESDLPEGVQLVDGELKAYFDTINVGSVVTHSYIVTPTTAIGEVYLEAATVQYKAEAEAEDLQVGYSTQAAIYVMTAVEQIQQHALTVGSYISLGSMHSGKDWRNVAIFLGVLGGLLGINQLVKSFKSATTTRKRQKALEALEKEQ